MTREISISGGKVVLNRFSAKTRYFDEAGEERYSVTSYYPTREDAEENEPDAEIFSMEVSGLEWLDGLDENDERVLRFLAPEPSEQEQLRADLDFLAAMLGVSL